MNLLCGSMDFATSSFEEAATKTTNKIQVYSIKWKIAQNVADRMNRLWAKNGLIFRESWDLKYDFRKYNYKVAHSHVESSLP